MGIIYYISKMLTLWLLLKSFCDAKEVDQILSSVEEAKLEALSPNNHYSVEDFMGEKLMYCEYKKLSVSQFVKFVQKEMEQRYNNQYSCAGAKNGYWAWYASYGAVSENYTVMCGPKSIYDVNRGELQFICEYAAYKCEEDVKCARNFIENNQKFCPGYMNVLVTSYYNKVAYSAYGASIAEGLSYLKCVAYCRGDGPLYK